MTKNAVILFAGISLCAIFFLTLLVPQNNKTTITTVSIKQTVGKPFELQFDTTDALQDYFSSVNYKWPIKSPEIIPSALIRSVPTDIHQNVDSKTRKQLFIRIMLPIIRAEQQRIREERKTLILALNSDLSNPKIAKRINSLFSEYKINTKANFEEKRAELLSRFDELPVTLVLAQAAIESGWGASRFSRAGNSLFGEWTFQKDAGIVPEQRQSGKTHQVKAFYSLRDSIASYTKNINRNNAYKELRESRKRMRENNQPLDARILAEGLHRYSQKGYDYVVSLLQILNSSDFKQIESLQLDSM